MSFQTSKTSLFVCLQNKPVACETKLDSTDTDSARDDHGSRREAIKSRARDGMYTLVTSDQEELQQTYVSIKNCPFEIFLKILQCRRGCIDVIGIAIKNDSKVSLLAFYFDNVIGIICLQPTLRPNQIDV